MVGETLTYSLVYKNVGYSTAAPVTLIDHLPVTTKASYLAGSAEAGGVYDEVGNTLRWDIPILAPGDAATVRYALVLPQWASTSSDELVNNADLLCSTGDIPAKVVAKVGGSVFVKFAVYNDAGEEVRVLATFWTSGTVTDFTIGSDVLRSRDDHIDVLYRDTPLASWDGRTANGTFVKNGSYFVKMDVVDPYGVNDAVVKCVSVVIPQRWVQMTIYNEAGEGVRFYEPEMVRRIMAGDDDLSTEDLKVGEVTLSPKVISPSYEDPSAPNGATTISFPSGGRLTWDGRNMRNEIVANGQYQVEIRSWGENVGEQTMLLPVAVLHGDLRGGSRTVLAPNPIRLSQDPKGVFLVTLVGPQVDHTVVRIFTLSGHIVENLSSAPGDPTRVEWPVEREGRYRQAVGLYLAVVEQRCGAGVVDRKIVKALLAP